MRETIDRLDHGPFIIRMKENERQLVLRADVLQGLHDDLCHVDEGVVVPVRICRYT